MCLVLVQFLAECFLPFLDRSTALVITMAVTHIVALVWPAMLLAEHAVFVGPACLLGFLGDAGVHRLPSCTSHQPLHLNCTGQFCIKFGIVLDVLEDQQEGYSTDGNGILCQVVLHVPLDWSHVQQVSCKVGLIQGQYLFGGLISLWTVVQVW